jgi:hypothetical protein
VAASPKEFREFAQECLRWADETKSERHRQVLRDMAKTWMQAALQLERSLALIDDSSVPRRSSPRPAKGHLARSDFRARSRLMHRSK